MILQLRVYFVEVRVWRSMSKLQTAEGPQAGGAGGAGGVPSKAAQAKSGQQ